MKTQTRNTMLTLLLCKIGCYPLNDDGLILFHDDDDPATDNKHQAGLRRALSDWRADVLEAGTDADAAQRAHVALDAALADLEDLMDDPTDEDRAALVASISTP